MLKVNIPMFDEFQNRSYFADNTDGNIFDDVQKESKQVYKESILLTAKKKSPTRLPNIIFRN